MQGRSLKTALAVSIILNLFALGAASGAMVMWLNSRHAPPAARGRPLMAAADALPGADRARYLATMRDTLRQAQRLQRAARENRRRAAELFVQPSFDAAVVGAAFAHARDADFMLRTRLETTMLAFAKDLPQSEREALELGLAKGGSLRHGRRVLQASNGMGTDAGSEAR